MSEKKMTDEELAKISGAGEKSAEKPDDPNLPPGGGGSGGGGGEVDTDAPGGDIQDFQKT